MNQIAPFGLRMAPELKELLMKKAGENKRSLNSELVTRLEASLKAEKENAPVAENN